MRKSIKKFSYIIFISLYPVLYLIEINVGQIPLKDGLRAILVMLGISLAFISLDIFTNKMNHNHGVIYVVLFTIFFSYERLRTYLFDHNFENLGRHRVLFVLYAIIFIISMIILKKFPINSNQNINIFSLVLVLFPIINIANFALFSPVKQLPVSSEKEIIINTKDQQLPDIYFVILDSYSRSDILEKVYDFDNSPFLLELKKRNFLIGTCSQSNYWATQLSLPATLNMDYLYNLDVEITKKGESFPPLWPFLHHSAVREIFSKASYQYISFNTSFYWADIEDADIYFSSLDPGEYYLVGNGNINEFEYLIIENSFGKYIFEFIYKYFLQQKNTKADNFTGHRNRTNFVLSKMEVIPDISGPTFSHIHLIIPHAPFIFGPNGEDVVPPLEETTERNREMYVDQVKFINDRLIPIIDTIIEKSEIPPIIILQGDHGGKDSFGEDRFAILNAIYLPYGDPDAFYSDISSVNTFRLILNEAFGADLEYLPDYAYSSYLDPEGSIVPNDLEGCANTQE